MLRVWIQISFNVRCRPVRKEIVSRDIEVERKQNSLSPVPVIKCSQEVMGSWCSIIPSNSRVEKYCLFYAGWLTNFSWFQGARPEHKRVESSCCCFLWGVSEFSLAKEAREFWPMTRDMFSSNRKRIWVGRYNNEHYLTPTKEVVLSLAAMFTLSPNKQYCGIFSPTRPADTGPKCIPWKKKWGSDLYSEEVIDNAI